jgi:type IV pilus assembly protein PilV
MVKRAMALYGQRGTTMIEVLVTLVIIALGLLGLAGLQVRLQSSEMESYQRTQALLLLADLKGRVEANRLEYAKYPDLSPPDAPVGAGMVCPAIDGTSSRADKDVSEWCAALQGAGEAAGGAKVGAMVGGRGCVEDLTVAAAAAMGGASAVVGEKVIRVSVAWQGLTPIAAPAETTCGAALYNGGAGSSCVNDLCRRAVSTIVRFAKLD